MAEGYDNTVSGLLRKRAELLGDQHRAQERLATIINAIACIDQVLNAFDYTGPLKGMRPSGTRNLLNDRHSVSRFVMSQMRNGAAGFSTREMATKLLLAAELDPVDRRLLDDMIDRVGKVLRTMRRHGAVHGAKDDHGTMRWSLIEG